MSQTTDDYESRSARRTRRLANIGLITAVILIAATSFWAMVRPPPSLDQPCYLGTIAVEGPQGEAIGDAYAVKLNPDAGIASYQVTFGGFLGMGEKIADVPAQGLAVIRDPKRHNACMLRLPYTVAQLQTRTEEAP